MSQILSALLWYLLLAGVGWLTFPIAYRLFSILPDRGYAFARPLGLMLWGFVFWLLSSFGFLQNSVGGLLTALALIAVFSYWAWRQARGEMGKWLRNKRNFVIGMEVLFAVAFLFMAFVRASRPEINHTEQPMELAFINAILRSPNMPPHDPWLSGFSISYYYFGYLMVAMLAKLVGVIGSVAFNLGFVSIFSMAALAAYGMASNLLTLYKPQAQRAFHGLALFAPLLVLILGNVEGLLEIAHARHLFWQTDASGQMSSPVWAYLDVKDLVNPPAEEPRWQPRLYGTGAWWWWRASRVINDRDYFGGEQELIDEIPAFSFVLGDLHPHVLSMPFVMLAIALALNVYLGAGEREPPLRWLGLRLQINHFVLIALIVGGLGFLNIWDFPIYIVLISGAYVVRRAQGEGWSMRRVEEFFILALAIGISGVLLYLPFYIGFTSQAAGILPNLLNPSRGTHLWILFGLFLTPIFVYLIVLWRSETLRRLAKSLLAGIGFVLFLWLISFGLAWLYTNILPTNSLGDAIRSLGAPDTASLVSESIQRRLVASGGWITLAILLGLLFGLVFKPADRRKASKATAAERQIRVFMLLLALVGALLVVAPEFIYLRDQFGTRMNTVFKFFFQAWQMWALVVTFIFGALLTELRGVGRSVIGSMMALLILVGLIYPVYAFSDITRRAPNQPLSLDGARYLSADSIAGFEWLRAAPLAPLAEAVGGSYDSSYARFATHAGQMGLMGWPGHEGQWRGGNVDFGRIPDIETLYSTANWDVAQSILLKYGVRYVIVSDAERFAYAVDEGKFQQHLQIGFQSGSVTIYLVP